MTEQNPLSSGATAPLSASEEALRVLLRWAELEKAAARITILQELKKGICSGIEKLAAREKAFEEMEEKIKRTRQLFEEEESEK